MSSSPPSNYDTIKIAHAALGSLTWVIFFPAGAILIRVLNTPNFIWIHAGIQVFSLILLVVTAGLGIYMANTTHKLSEYHPVIGIVLLGIAFVQTIGGFLQHWLVVKNKNVSIISLTHMWLGRGIVTLGMINGGLGLLFSGDGSKADYIAYGVVAGVVWVLYVFVVFFAENGEKITKRKVREVEKMRQGDD